MKRIYLIVALAILAFTSCSDFLDPDIRSSESSADFYATTTGFESLTNATYSSLRNLYNIQPLLFSAGTDIYGDGKSQGVIMNHYTAFTATEGIVETYYENCFQGIQLANSVISYGETTSESNVRDQYIDEARFIRAWYYFQLAQQFGKVALNTQMFDYAEMNHARTDLETVYTFIIDEFTFLASDNSSLLDRSTSDVGRANKRAASFFLSKAYLTRAWLNGEDYESLEENIAQSSDFSNAATYAIQAIDGESPSLSIDEAFDYSNESNAEIFWSIQFDYSAVEDPSSDGSYQQAQFGSYLGGSENARNKSIDGNLGPFLRLHQLFEKGDGRYEQTFMLEFHTSYFDYYSSPTTSEIQYYYAPAWATAEDISAWQADDPYGLKTNTLISKTIADGGIAPSNGAADTYFNRRNMDFGVACIKKFDDYSETSINNRSTTCSMHDVVVARLGEAYLIAAEAYVEMGQTDNAAAMINTLRSRPNTIKSGFESAMSVSADDMTIDFILDERAREMAGEYVRWTDLKRTHKLVEYVTTYNEDGITAADMTGDDGNYKFLRPIPQTAIDRNQAVVEQNPGY
ncbi:RagB/SusD family nutrient uptake outer membrane protein [uncultured Sunxiuqinia sp.]|uniref:RagB/SusD family nutrient uptake outer membrane protein n=1 Tax=uncultured Sunxiuqinia sp. TaxID=1573825 RepID=UPI002AA8CFD6|nr:RagB/SusD family nutrient uptake outer membrane protein [uncultured Sunxiuqinia sp.]